MEQRQDPAVAGLQQVCEPHYVMQVLEAKLETMHTKDAKYGAGELEGKKSYALISNVHDHSKALVANGAGIVRDLGIDERGKLLAAVLRGELGGNSSRMRPRSRS